MLNTYIDINGETVVDGLDMNKLLRVLLLIESNNHLSIAVSALKERSKNRNEAIDILCKLLDISYEQLEEYYRNWLDEQ